MEVGDQRVLHSSLSFIGALLACIALLCISSSKASALPEKFYGVDMAPAQFGEEPDWEALQHAGVNRVHMQISWSTVIAAGNWEAEPAWEATFDSYFEKAAKHGIAILPYLYTREEGNTAYYLVGGAHYNDWLRFVWTVVQRYGQAGTFWFHHLSLPQYPVSTWEVWNEPNLPNNCPSGVCNGKQYGEFLVGTSKTIHEAQEKLGYVPKVLFGGLYEERWNYLNEKPGYVGIYNYLGEAAKAPGIGTAYDGLSIHPYALGRQEEAVRKYSEKAGGVPTDVFEAWNAQKNKIGNKPVWVTEVGWPTDGAEMQHVTPEEQAGLLSETYNWLKQNQSTYNIQFGAWYWYKDTSADPKTKWDLHCGLRDSAGEYRESWYAYEAQTGVQEWPPRWHTDNLGGSISEAPDIASWGSGRLDVFGRKTDGSLTHNWWNGSSWNPEWETVGSPGTFASGVGAAGSAGKEINVVGRSSSNAVVDEWWNGSSWQLVNFGGNILGDPDFSSPISGTGANIWARGAKGTLEHRWWTGTEWSPWTDMKVAIASSPGAVSWGSNRIDVVTRASNGSVQDTWWNGTETQTTNLGGSIEGTPTIASWGPGRLDVFVKGTDGALWSNWYENSEWHTWHSLGGSLASDPGAVSWGPGRIDVVARISNGTIQHWWWQQ